MPFFTPALVGGLASAIGAIGSGFLGIYGQSSANRANYDIAQMTNAANVVAAGRAQDFSAAQAQINRDFQERLSSTSWQRAVADMRKAGINPLLAVSQGGACCQSSVWSVLRVDGVGLALLRTYSGTCVFHSINDYKAFKRIY